jgi:hypothetical protein
MSTTANTKYDDIYLTWRGDVTSTHAMAQHARNLLEPLIKGGASVRIESINPYNKRPADLSPWWNETLKTSTATPVGIVKINHCDPAHATKNESGGPTILYTRWDSWQVPKTWVQTINDTFTECWVTNKFVLERNKADNITIPKKVIPYGLDWKRYSQKDTKSKIVGVPTDNIILGTTMSWNNKENASDLIIAYCTEFTADIDKVSLVIKIDSNNPDDPNEKAKVINLVQEIKKLVGGPKMPPVVLIQDVFTQDGIDDIISAFDIYVSAARSKSKNITMLKTLAANKQAVFVNSGIHNDYFNPEYANLYPVNYVLEPITQMAGMYAAHDLWPRPDVAHLMHQMRAAYNEWYLPKTSKNGKMTAELLRKEYDIKMVIKNFADNIRAVSPKIGATV